MRKLICIIFSVALFLVSCSTKPDKKLMEKWKQEIRETEQNFSKMAGEEGIHKAFIAFAAEDAVLMRNNELVEGLTNITEHLKNQTSKGLSWAPDFVDVAASGDLAYTYGHFNYSYVDTTGKVLETKGIFHTVWKRQTDGIWKFVWD